MSRLWNAIVIFLLDGALFVTAVAIGVIWIMGWGICWIIGQEKTFEAETAPEIKDCWQRIWERLRSSL